MIALIRRALFASLALAAGTVRPAGTDVYASVNALSTRLASYLAAYGSRVGVEVLDVTRATVYTSNASGTFITASSVKVPIMLAVMARAERAPSRWWERVSCQWDVCRLAGLRRPRASIAGATARASSRERCSPRSEAAGPADS